MLVIDLSVLLRGDFMVLLEFVTNVGPCSLKGRLGFVGPQMLWL
jgi:hypothetical protein